MITNNSAPTEKALIPALQNRWSPLAFSSEAVSQKEVEMLLEAARWAPSAFNEQPWQYIVGHQGDETFNKIAESLMEGNSWAKNAGVLMVSVAKTFFEHKHKPNRHYAHDTGAATVLMHVQATEMGLYMHQMSGFDVEVVRKSFSVGEDYEPMAVMAIGHPGDHDSLSEDLKKREESPRQRKGMEEMIWKG